MTDQTQATTIVNTQVPQQAEKMSTKDSIMSFVPLVVIFVIFYFFIIRPQIKKQKAQQGLINSAKKGDTVVAAGGIIGKIIKEKEKDIVSLEIAKDIHVDVLKSSIVSIVNK
ncbi:MAG: preprotein translocase subunit YajC [Rickettsiales bacterium]|nr:preprotein translocase subunit YajC [Rickettsiales bacterium]